MVSSDPRQRLPKQCQYSKAVDSIRKREHKIMIVFIKLSYLFKFDFEIQAHLLHAVKREGVHNVNKFQIT